MTSLYVPVAPSGEWLNEMQQACWNETTWFWSCELFGTFRLLLSTVVYLTKFICSNSSDSVCLSRPSLPSHCTKHDGFVSKWLVSHFHHTVAPSFQFRLHFRITLNDGLKMQTWLCRNHDASFLLFDTVPACDRQTDRQTRCSRKDTR